MAVSCKAGFILRHDDVLIPENIAGTLTVERLADKVKLRWSSDSDVRMSHVLEGFAFLRHTLGIYSGWDTLLPHSRVQGCICIWCKDGGWVETLLASRQQGLWTHRHQGIQ